MLYMHQRQYNPTAVTYVLYGVAVLARKCRFILPHWWLGLKTGTCDFLKSRELGLPYKAFHLWYNASDSHKTASHLNNLLGWHLQLKLFPAHFYDFNPKKAGRKFVQNINTGNWHKVQKLPTRININDETLVTFS